MVFNLKELLLHETYDFDVVISSGGIGFAGKLNLSPKKINLKIMGERSEERTCPINWEDRDQLICKYLNKTFILNGLTAKSGQSIAVSHYPKTIGYFEMSFDVNSVIYCSSGIFDENSFYALDIYSETVSRWIGNTETQHNVINAQRTTQNKADELDLTEFTVDVDSLGTIGVHYNVNIYYSISEFKSGVIFPPSLFLICAGPKGGSEVKALYDSLYNLLSLLTGDELTVEKVRVRYLSLRLEQWGSLYYPTDIIPKRRNDSCILLPLGKDILFDTLGLPPMPLDVFRRYYSLPQNEMGYWVKYLRYRRMANVEERFLGYFRILEALSAQKKEYVDGPTLMRLVNRFKPCLIKQFGDKRNVSAFIRGLPRYNSSKYNTEKCIQDFFLSIPSGITDRWQFGKKDIGDVCKLRNDITHANDYNISDHEIERKCTFIEILLIFALFSRAGIAFETTGRVIDRLNGYHLIVRRSR